MNDTKKHILNVSLLLFLRKSFKEVTMKEIVEKTGMSKGAVYHYFESKEQLFLEVLTDSLDDILVDYTKFSKDSLNQFFHDYIDNFCDISAFISCKFLAIRTIVLV